MIINTFSAVSMIYSGEFFSLRGQNIWLEVVFAVDRIIILWLGVFVEVCGDCILDMTCFLFVLTSLWIFRIQTLPHLLLICLHLRYSVITPAQEQGNTHNYSQQIGARFSLGTFFAYPLRGKSSCWRTSWPTSKTTSGLSMWQVGSGVWLCLPYWWLITLRTYN